MKPRLRGVQAVIKLLDELEYRMIGTVKWFNPTKGFGFIAPEDGGKDAFVHVSAVERAGLTHISEGQRIEYDLESGRDGKMSAANLRVLD